VLVLVSRQLTTPGRARPLFRNAGDAGTSAAQARDIAESVVPMHVERDSPAPSFCANGSGRQRAQLAVP
jgi:hypothetical protein